MKYIKTYESLNDKLVKGYEGEILINKPSQQYFKSGINYQVIFVDHVFTKYLTDTSPETLVYNVKASDAIQINDDLSLTYTDWNQDYVSWEFDTESFIRLLEETIKESKNNLKTEWFKKKLSNIIDRLTIDETEHIVVAQKYNL